MSTKTTHSWTWLGGSLTSLKQSLKHHQLPPNNYTRQHVYLRTPPRREHRMLFAEIGSQGGRSTPTSLQSTPFSSLHATSFALAQQAVVRDLWIWRTPVARRALSHPPVRTEHTPIDLTHTPLDFPLSGAQLHLSAGPHLPTPHATAAHGHTPNQHRFCDCSSCPSIHRECGDRVSHFHHSSRRAVSPLGPVPTHQSLRHSHWLFVPVRK